MEVILICLGIIAVIAVIVAISVLKSKNYKKNFFEKPQFEKDRYLLSRINEIGTFNSTDSSGNIIHEPEKQTVNRQKLIELLYDGADIVMASGINYPALSHSGGVDVVTPSVVIQKRFNFATRVTGTASVIATNVMWVNHFLPEKITRTGQASVVGQAVVGGVIAGGVGAVVGAVDAASKNASGGVERTVGLRKHYFLASVYGGEMIDTICVKTSVIRHFGAPPEAFVVEKNSDYWLLQATAANRMIGGMDKGIYDAYAAYFARVLNAYKPYARYQGTFADLHTQANA